MTRHLKTPIIAALALAYGLVVGYEAAIGNRIIIPDGTAIETIRPAIFGGGLIAALCISFGLKLAIETVKIGAKHALKLLGYG